MGLDGLFLHHLINELKILEQGRIQKINQIGKNEFLFIVHKNKKYKLLISLDRNYYRINLTDKEYTNPKEATMFTMLLRKHFEGGIINSINQFETDRIIEISISNTNEFYDRKEKKMILELMGKNSNLIITNKDNEIIDAFKKIGVSDSGNTILPHAYYNYPENNKINIYKNIISFDINSKDDIINNIYGMSPKFAYFAINQDNPTNYLNNLKNVQIKPSIYTLDNKKDFYFIPLSDKYITYDNLSDLIEDYYYEKTINDIKKSTTNNLEITIDNAIKKLKRKLNNLEDDLNNANNNLKYLKLGTLLINNLYQLPNNKVSSVTVFDYEENKDIKINLDNLKTIKENANSFFTKANKAKKSLIPINEQIEKTNNEIEYLELISYQIKEASLSDIEQIKDELILNHIIKDTSNKKKKINKKIDVLTYEIDGTKVYVGKNNTQNDYISNHLAKTNNIWFHIKDGPGSHVVILKDELNEKEIRFCANLAALNSYYKDSSSVPVIYTKIKYLKKIPGKMNCFLQYSNEKTIYIDPTKNG